MITKVCDVCGKSTNDYIITIDGDIVCDSCCAHDKIKRCGCGSWILTTKQRCNDCEEKLYKVDINPYSTKPVPMFKNHYTELRIGLPKQRYYGFEMEFNHVLPGKIHTLGFDLYKEKLIYNKSDSSIYDGVEVVTSPLDRKSLNKFFTRLEPMLEYVRGKAYDDNAGLHIHVSKDSIPPMDRYKLCLLLNNPDVFVGEKNIMYLLSGRKKRVDWEVDDHYYRLGAGYNGWKCEATGHDKALNTANTTTYEFRIFRSSADKDVLMSYVELTDKMIEFCHITGLKDITISKFIQWLKVNTKNKIIIAKIKEYEDSSGMLPSVGRLITSDEFMYAIKGISWEDYGKIAASLHYNKNMRTALAKYEEYGDATKAEGYYKDIQEKLLNTFRKTAINYILKNQDREELKCA